MEILTLQQFLLMSMILLVAYLVRGVAGFGSGLIAIPFLSLFLPLILVVPLVVLLDYLASLGHGFGNRAHIQWRELLPLLPFTVTGIVLALLLLKQVDGDWMKKTLGVFIVAYAAYSFLPGKEGQAGSRYWSIPAGGFGGLIGTLFGTGGPFYVAYLKMRGLPKTNFRATLPVIFLIDGSMRLAGYSALGAYSGRFVKILLIAFPVMVLAMFLGGRIHSSISHQGFQRIIGILLLVSGTMLIVR
jgi:uncharacterized membrane protein YfcA